MTAELVTHPLELLLVVVDLVAIAGPLHDLAEPSHQVEKEPAVARNHLVERLLDRGPDLALVASELGSQPRRARPQLRIRDDLVAHDARHLVLRTQHPVLRSFPREHSLTGDESRERKRVVGVGPLLTEPAPQL